MTKKDLAEKISVEENLSKAASEKCIVSIFDEIAKALSKGDEITIPGFGKFSVSKRAARMGRNPQTKEQIKIPASKSVRFKVAKALKDTLNK